MNIAIDLRPLQEYSRFRGIGTVTYEITKALINNYPENKYFFCFYRNVELPIGLEAITKKGTVLSLGDFSKSFGKSKIPKEKTELSLNRKLDVFLATDPSKKIPNGSFRKVVIFYDLISLIFTEDYLKAKSGSLKIDLLKKIKLHRFAIIKKVITRQFKEALTADKILAISKTTKKDLVDNFKIPDEKIDVMYLAAANFFKKLDNTDRSALQDKYGLSEKFIFYVGGLDYRKNILNLLKAISLITDANFPQLIIGGKDVSRKLMPEAMEIKHFLQKNHLGSKVKLIDYIENDDLVKFYNCAEFFVFPSLYEGFGLGVLEAMACGTPVVCSNTPAVKEVAEDSALYFNPNNPNDIAEKMISLHKDPTLRNTLVTKGRQQIKKFSWKNSSEVVMDAFK